MSARISCASVSLEAKVGEPREAQAPVGVPPASTAPSDAHFSAPHSGFPLPQRAVKHHTFRVQLAAVVPTHNMPARAHSHHAPLRGHYHRASHGASGALPGPLTMRKRRRLCVAHTPRVCLRERSQPVGGSSVHVHVWRWSGLTHRARFHRPNSSFNRTRVGVASSIGRLRARRLTLR